MSDLHTFHIPVMGTAFTADTPLKVSQYGINSVISIMDDVLLERLRKFYSDKNNLEYKEIKKNTIDYRADRITSYLNLVNDITLQKFNSIVNSVSENFEEITKYFEMLPEGSKIKNEFLDFTSANFSFTDLSNWLKENMSLGSIDVNIMTKVDKKNYFKNEELPAEYNDAHAALRGYAKSNLTSSVIFSAGMNPRLYGYIASFDDFFPDSNGFIKKKIVLKVSDFRSAIIQGKFLAKKGLWVSEYRIESGLNCGGHAFATDGYLMGPILAEFRDKKIQLIEDTHLVYKEALEKQKKYIPNQPLNIKITAQGGVGTAKEHDFLIKHYNLDSVGWGTPFLLVPEVTTVDQETMIKLQKAKESDLYLSKISPLGVPFNHLRNTSAQNERIEKIKKGKPGSPCPRRYLALGNEYGSQGVCTASRLYQKNKIKENKINDTILEKTCLCVGLAAASIINNNIDVNKESKSVSICPGPNMAYYDKLLSLTQMTSFIYNDVKNIVREDRPNLFLKELGLYTEYLKEKVLEHNDNWGRKSEKYLSNFICNIEEGTEYYQKLFKEFETTFSNIKVNVTNELTNYLNNIKKISNQIEALIEKNQK